MNKQELIAAVADASGLTRTDAGKAVEVYREVASKFPSHKLAKRAEDRVAKLEAAMPHAYAAEQERPVIPEAAYNDAFGTTDANNYAKNDKI